MSGEFFKLGEIVEVTDASAAPGCMAPNLKIGERFTVMADTQDGNLVELRNNEHGLKCMFARWRFSRVK